jgi:hypothetical protein
MIEPLESDEEYQEERGQARENIDDDQHHHQRWKIFLKVITAYAWIYQLASLPESCMADTDTGERGPPRGRWREGAGGAEVG